MERIILIETSTSLCSAALAEDAKIVSFKKSSEPHAHASMTASFVKEMLDDRGLAVKDCSAVCVSKGPGSYTGLRVGVSTAKGLCFGAGIPLISVGTLDTLVWQAIDGGLLPDGCKYVVDGHQVSPTVAQVVDGETFASRLSEGPVLFIGDGAEKCKDVIASPNAYFEQCCPKASSMLHPAVEAFRARKFEDVAYFEPFYLKEFIATVSKHKIF